MLNTLERFHVAPIGINDTLSARAYDLTLEQIDPYYLIYTQSDLDHLKQFKYSLDNNFEENANRFVDTLAQLFNDRVKLIEEQWLPSISLEKVLAYNDSVKFSRSKSSKIATDLTGLEKRMQKWFILRTFERTYSNFPELNLTKKDSVKIAVSYCLEQEKSNLSCFWKSIGYPDQKIVKSSFEKIFLNSLAKAYDPHSDFFSADEKNELETMLSPSEDSFGLYLYEEDNAIKVYDLHEHSDAWKSSLINRDDIIKSAIDQNGEELIDDCTSASELESRLNSQQVVSVTLVLIKANGKEIKVELFKEILSSESNNLVGYVLNGKRKVGYIALPSFYTSWDMEDVNGCANDVAKEILKLKNDQIEGLILDLRDNGGGSVKEALDLVGIFIDIGPIGIVNNRENQPRLMKDFNRGAAYSGPLVVLINGGSASASEVVAGGLKYHQRAVIVGSRSFGKATGQVILPTDSTYWNFANPPASSDFVKVTISTIYQPDNTTHQLKGIIPDIEIPDAWANYYPHESDEHYPIHPISISKNVYFTPSSPLPIDNLKELSATRLSEDSTFRYIQGANDSIAKDLFTPYSMILNLPSVFEKNQDEDQKIEEILEKSERTSPDFSFETPKFYEMIAEMDKSFEKNAQRLKLEMEKDPTLNESFLILMDLIQLK